MTTEQVMVDSGTLAAKRRRTMAHGVPEEPSCGKLRDDTSRGFPFWGAHRDFSEALRLEKPNDAAARANSSMVAFKE